MPLEHGARTGALAGWLAQAAGGSDEEAAVAARPGLLHALGCTSDATETAAQLGDDRAARAAWTRVDGGRPQEVVRFLWEQTGEVRSGRKHAASFARALAAGRGAARTRFTTHCEVAERLAERLGAPAAVRDGLWDVFERWGGRGPAGGGPGGASPRAGGPLPPPRGAGGGDF